MLFSEKLTIMLRKKQMSIRAIARGIGVSNPTILGWKSGAVPQDRYRRRIAEFFGEKESELFDETLPVSEKWIRTAPLHQSITDADKLDKILANQAMIIAEIGVIKNWIHTHGSPTSQSQLATADALLSDAITRRENSPQGNPAPRTPSPTPRGAKRAARL